MNEVKKISNEELGCEWRVIDQNGDPWFVGNDVASSLGYSRPRDAVRDFCKGGVILALPSCTSDSGVANAKIIPLPDVFRLIMRSKLPLAERYSDWVYEEILPAVYKHGTYTAPSARGETRREMLDAALDRLLEERAKVRALDEIRIDCAPLDPFGARSPKNGRKREKLIRAYWRSARKHHEPPPWVQLALFGTA